MPIVPYEDIATNPAVASVANTPGLPIEPESPGFWSTLGAAYQLYAPQTAGVEKLQQYWYGPFGDARFGEVVEGYEPLDDIEGFEADADLFVELRNPYAVATMKNRIRFLRKQEETLARAGFGGAAATLAVSAFGDPVNALMLPFLSPTRAVWNTARGITNASRIASSVSIARTAAKTAAFAAGDASIAVALSEFTPVVGLQSTLETRTTRDGVQDVLISAGLAAVGGGVIGGFRAKRFNFVQNMRREMEKGRSIADEVLTKVKELPEPRTAAEFENNVTRVVADVFGSENSLAMNGAVRAIVGAQGLVGSPEAVAMLSSSATLRTLAVNSVDAARMLERGTSKGALTPVESMLFEHRARALVGIHDIEQEFYSYRKSHKGAGSRKDLDQYFSDVGLYLLFKKTRSNLPDKYTKAVKAGADRYREGPQKILLEAGRASGHIHALNEVAEHYPIRVSTLAVGTAGPEKAFSDFRRAVESYFVKKGGGVPESEELDRITRGILDNIEKTPEARNLSDRGIPVAFSDPDAPVDWSLLEEYLHLDPRYILDQVQGRSALADALLSERFNPAMPAARSLPSEIKKLESTIRGGDRLAARGAYRYAQDVRMAVRRAVMGVGPEGPTTLAEGLARAEEIVTLAKRSRGLYERLGRLRAERAPLARVEKEIAERTKLLESASESEKVAIRTDLNRLNQTRQNLEAVTEAKPDQIQETSKALGAVEEELGKIRKQIASLDTMPERAIPAKRADLPEGVERGWDAIRREASDVSMEHADAGANANHILKDVELELRSKGVPEGKIQRELASGRTIINALRGTEFAPADDASVAFKSLSFLKQAAAVRWLGGVALSSLGDVALGILQAGAGSWFRGMAAGISGSINGAPKSEIQRIAEAIERMNSSRIRSLHFMGEGIEGTSAPGFSDTFFKYTGINWWNGKMRGYASHMSQDSLLRAIKKQQTGGKLTRTEANILDQARVDEALGARIWEKFEAHGEVQNGLHLSNVENWGDPSLERLYRGTVMSQVNRINLVPSITDLPRFKLTGETRPWMSRAALEILFQFKGFALAATNKVLVSSLQRHDQAVAMGITSMIGAGMLVELLKRKEKEGSLEIASLLGAEPERKESDPLGLNDLFFNAVDRSGVLGMVMDMNNLIDRATPARGPVNLMFGGAGPSSRFRTEHAYEAAIGPAFGGVFDAMDVWARSADGDITGSDAARIRQLIPYQNVFYLRWLFDSLEGAFAGAVSSEELQ